MEEKIDSEGRQSTLQPSETGKERLCGSKRKKQLREEYTLFKKAKRKEKKQKRKERLKLSTEHQSSEENIDNVKDVEQTVPHHESKRDQKLACERRCREALISGQRVSIDLSMEHLMSNKERSKVAQQLCRLYGANKRSPSPFHVYFSGLSKEGSLYKECLRKNQGFENYMIDMTGSLLTELFKPDEVVYLSPDAETALTSIDPSKVYVIGGIVDESIKKNVTKSQSEESGISCVRLPIDEYMEKQEGMSSYSRVLALNQVFEILLTFSRTGDWRTALSEHVPKRKGYIIREEKSDLPVSS